MNIIKKQSIRNYLGFKNNVNEWILKSSFIALHSLWGEGCPTSILEAFSLGVPALAYDIDGNHELIQNNHNGYLIEKYNKKMENLESIKENVKQLFTAYLEKKGQRRTPERYAILDEIYSNKKHFDVDTLYIQMKNRNYHVSRATVYNTLNHFADNGLIKTLQVDNQKTFFDTNTDHHYHYKYKDKLRDISISDLEIKYNQKSIPEGKKVASIDVVINLCDE